MEVWDLCDAKKHPLHKTIERGKSHPDGTYHLVVQAWLVNEKGELLLTLRDETKEQYPLTWENQGGSAQAGEDSLTAIQREIAEETGIHAAKSDFQYIDTLVEKTAVVDMYLLRTNVTLEQIVLQETETADKRWVNAAQLKEMLKQATTSPATVRRTNPIWDKLMRLI